MNRREFIEAIAQGIATMEGFYKPGSLSEQNNNPGNLRSWGSVPVVEGYAKFPSVETGWRALRTQIGKNIDRGLTMQEFFGGKPGVYGGYSPAADKNNPHGYAQYVAGRLKVAPDVQLSTLFTA